MKIKRMIYGRYLLKHFCGAAKVSVYLKNKIEMISSVWLNFTISTCWPLLNPGGRLSLWSHGCIGSQYSNSFFFPLLSHSLPRLPHWESDGETSWHWTAPDKSFLPLLRTYSILEVECSAKYLIDCDRNRLKTTCKYRILIEMSNEISLLILLFLHVALLLAINIYFSLYNLTYSS